MGVLTFTPEESLGDCDYILFMYSNSTGLNQYVLTSTSVNVSSASYTPKDDIYAIRIGYKKDEKTTIASEIDYYPEVFGSCGGGAFALSETKESIAIPKNAFWEFSSFKRYSVINAVGSSMSPSIIDRDKLIIEHWDNEQIKDDRVYVFCYKDEIFVKRLIKNIDEIIVKSDNPDPMYRPRYIEGEDMNNVIIVGQVVGIVRDLK
jgi:phage repressor protein C with HTH and peptisase S24 domain